MYPIERYNWLYAGIDEKIECVRYTKSVYKLSIFKDGSIHIGLSNLTFFNLPFEELQAIYETAKQIKEENN